MDIPDELTLEVEHISERLHGLVKGLDELSDRAEELAIELDDLLTTLLAAKDEEQKHE